MKNLSTISFAEAYNQLDILLEYMRDNSFDPKQIMSVKLAQSALLNFELINIITFDNQDKSIP